MRNVTGEATGLALAHLPPGQVKTCRHFISMRRARRRRPLKRRAGRSAIALFVAVASGHERVTGVRFTVSLMVFEDAQAPCVETISKEI